MKKIAIDLTSFKIEFSGGKEQVIINLIRGFVELGYEHNIGVFCYDYYEKKVKKLIPNADIVTFKRIKCKKLIQDTYIRTFLLKKHLVDVDIIFFPIYYTGFTKFKITSIVIPHDIQFKSNKKAFGLLERIKERILYYNDFKKRDYIIAISEFDKNEIKKYYKKFANKVVKINNPINYLEQNVKSKREHIVAINIAFEHKNIEALLKAYKLIENQIKYNLILIGNVNKKLKISELIEKMDLSDRVKITGYIDEKEVKDLLVNSILYITTSKYEGFGMASVEALLNKVPVISTYQEALTEVTFNKSFYYKSYDDEIALSKVILEVLNNYPTEKYLEGMKKLAYDKYNYLFISKIYIDFFKKVSNKIFFIDPMSYHNLALYDFNLLSNIDKNLEVRYFGNKQYNLTPIKNIKKIYNYSKYKLNIFKVISYIYSNLIVYREIIKQKCKVIHIQWSRMPYLDCLFIRYIKKKYSIKIVYTSHDTFSHNFEKSKKKGFLKFMREIDDIIVHTLKGKEILEIHNIKNATIINHGLLDISKIYKASKVEYEKNSKIVFSLLGYMEEYKGTDLLLKAWIGSNKLLGNKNIELIVIGKNKMNYKPIIFSKYNIVYKDEIVSDGEFTKWMELTDVVVLPYQNISQSGLLLTALAMKKTCIVNDVGEIAKPIKKYQLGWVINETTIEGLRKKLEEIVIEIEKNGIKKVDEKTIKKIDNDYSWKEAGKLTSQIYEK